MRPSRLRAWALIELIGVLPLIGAIFFVGFALVSHVVQVQSAEDRLLSDTAMARDLVRRVQADAALADEAWLERQGDLATVRLHHGTRTVSYRFVGQQVTREERNEGAAAETYGWRFTRTRVDAIHEKIGSSPGLVWMMFESMAPMMEGPAVEHRLSAAATIGRGGAS
jgi:hypothetical protein